MMKSEVKVRYQLVTHLREGEDFRVFEAQLSEWFGIVVWRVKCADGWRMSCGFASRRAAAEYLAWRGDQ